VYLTSGTVEGFRGIGNPVTPTFPPGPGSRSSSANGTGKSSFAEGLQLLRLLQGVRAHCVTARCSRSGQQTEARKVRA
jgi:hypothetical protein